MNKRIKLNRRHRPARVERSVMFRGSVRDPAAARAVREVEVLDDYHWLLEHPEAKERHRPATMRELLAYGLPPGSHVVVVRGPAGTQFHMMCPPKK